MLAAVACQPEARRSPQQSPALRAAIEELLRAADLQAALADWRLPPASFARVVAPTYHRLYEGYLAAQPLHTRRLALALAAAGGPSAAVVEARHWANDPALSLAQARTRWAQPLQAVSWRVSLGGTAIDAVWVEDAGRFYLLDGVDDAALALLAKAAPDCAAAAAAAGRPGRCSDAVWGAVDGALRDRPEAVQRSCARVLALCDRVAAPGSR